MRKKSMKQGRYINRYRSIEQRGQKVLLAVVLAGPYYGWKRTAVENLHNKLWKFSTDILTLRLCDCIISIEK